MKRIQTRIVVGVLALATLTCAAAAQNRTSARLVELNAAISQKAKTGQGQFDNAFRRMATERRELMSKLAESDPAAAMRSILPAETLEKIPADFAVIFERRATFSGELTVEAECEEHDFRTHRYIASGEGKKQLYLDGEPTLEMKSGDQIVVSGYEIDSKILASGDQATVTTTAAATATTGDHRVLVIMVNFQDKQTQPFTSDTVRDVTFNTSNQYYREASFGQAALSGDVMGWFTIPVSSTVCDKNGIATYAKQAAQTAGADLAAYDHFVYAFPTNTCAFAGSATIGGTNQVWMNGVYKLNIVAHELGHNFGLGHSRSIDCGAEVMGDTCTTYEYGDTVDIMGTSYYAHFNLFHKERLGWVNTSGPQTIQTVSTSGTYWIDGYATSAGPAKGLKVLKSIDPVSGAKTWYYIERRIASGFDAVFSGNANIENGVVVRTGTDGAYQSYLLDMTPGTDSWDDPALTTGQSFTDPASGVTITTTFADSTGAFVRVDVPAQSCTRANPSVSITPGQTPWLKAGTSYSYSVAVVNNNGIGCGTESFNLTANVPAGWTANYSNPALNIAPGGNATATLTVVSAASAPNGSYSLTANAATPGSSAGASASYVVVSSLAVNASPGAANYTRSQKATVTAAVSALGAPTAGASVLFTLTKPNGTVVTKSVVTDSTGKAAFVYTFDKRRDPTGTYRVTAAATSGAISGTGTTSFNVTK